MKRKLQFITFALATFLLSSGVAAAQQTTATEKEKQKEADLKLKREMEQLKKAEYINQAQIDAEIQKAKAEMESHEDAIKDYAIIRKRAEGLSGKGVYVFPDESMWNITVPDMEHSFYYGNFNLSDKPGSSWNYSRQVMESTFTNEFVMDSGGDNGNATLSLSGNCAEGEITVAIIMPDGKQLSEVIIDANGSLNWRKSFEAGEGDGWKNGKWVFKIRAKEATGNFRISMTTN